MEITKELKEKLLCANSKEEVKALLGEGAAEEETARIWHEIRKNRNPSDLESVDDDELEAVSGGVFCFDDDAPDGHESSCFLSFHRKNECVHSKDPDGIHYWVHENAAMKCRYCGKVYLESWSGSGR